MNGGMEKEERKEGGKEREKQQTDFLILIFKRKR